MPGLDLLGLPIEATSQATGLQHNRQEGDEKDPLSAADRMVMHHTYFGDAAQASFNSMYKHYYSWYSDTTRPRSARC